jgi:hypothetical protein
MSINKIMHLTIKGKTDGFGAQYQAILSGIAYCRYKKYIYVHSPITRMEHDVDVEKANDFIGIDIHSVVDPGCNILEQPFILDVHRSNTPSMYYTDEVLEMIRKCYYSSKKPNVCEIDIAIHIRRGDVSDNENKLRFTPNHVYKIIIHKLKEKYPGYTITVFSEGNYADFIDCGLEEKYFRLNEDIFETFHSLVSSKVLIMGLSSFSYCAGIINKNTVYHYDSFWHKKLDHWLRLGDLLN